MDKAGIAFLVLICILVALVLSLLALRPSEEAPPIPPAIVPQPDLGHRPSTPT
jgi:nitric oxide reductase large subunit